MSEPIWNKFLTERDKQVFAAGGYGAARRGQLASRWHDHERLCSRDSAGRIFDQLSRDRRRRGLLRSLASEPCH